MRILEVTHRYPPRTGGVERHVEAISRELAERGHDVTVVTADRQRDEPVTEHVDGVRVIRHGSLAPGGNYHLNPIHAIGARRSDHDVIHVHNYHSFPAVLAALGTRGTPLVFTPHYHGGSDSPLRDLLLGPYGVLGRRAIRKADTVIALTAWEADRLREDFGVEPEVIPNGLEYDQVQAVVA